MGLACYIADQPFWARLRAGPAHLTALPANKCIYYWVPLFLLFHLKSLSPPISGWLSHLKQILIDLSVAFDPFYSCTVCKYIILNSEYTLKPNFSAHWQKNPKVLFFSCLRNKNKDTQSNKRAWVWKLILLFPDRTLDLSNIMIMRLVNKSKIFLV